MKSFKFKDLMVNVAGGERAAFCGFGYTCNYGTYCGWITPCGFTCDYGNTHPTRTFFEEQARAAAPAARAGFFCGFGQTCNYGTVCGWSIEPCGYTCDVGATHPVTRTVFEEQARAAAPAAQAGPGGEARICALPTVHCFNATCNACTIHTCFGCSRVISCITGTGIPCAFGSCGFTGDPTPTIQVDPEGVNKQLAAVKAQLQQELAAIEQQEKAVAEALRPQTAADVEELQGKLRDAITELDKQKQELQKKSDKPKK